MIEINKNTDFCDLLDEHSIFKTIVENMSESVWIGDENERTLYANPNFCNLLGYSLEEIKGEKSYIFWDEDSKNLVKEHNKYRKKGKTSKYEGNLLTKDGKRIPVLLSGAPLGNKGSVGIMTNLSEFKTAQKLANYQKIINSSSMFAEIDLKRNFYYINKNFSKKTGFSKDSVLGKNFFDCLVYKDKDFLRNEILQILEVEKRVWKGEIKLFQKNEKKGYIRVFVTIIPILNKKNNIEGFIALAHDITQQKDLQKKIEEYNLKEIKNKNQIIQQLKEISETKDEFLNIASHELRTPMTTIKGYVSMLLDGDAGELNEEMRFYLNKVYESSNRLISLINDMLDVEKLESGEIQFEYSEFQIKILFEEVYQEMKQHAVSKSQDFQISLDIDDLIIKSDYYKLFQIFVNLISNSFKFTPEGGIIVLGACFEGDYLKFYVNDDGEGISKDNVDRIFDKFGQIKNPLTRSVNGTGLGLSIVKMLVEKLGGTVGVETELGKGSTFSVCFKKSLILKV